MADYPRLPIHYLLNPDFGVSPDVTLRILSGDGKVEGELKAHGIILALGSSVLKEILFSKSGELISWKVVEVRGASLKTTKWMLEFLYSKPAEERDWNDASAQDIFQLASLADQFHLTELQEKATTMLMNLPILEDDILEVASYACDCEDQIPTASKALLDNCTSMLASKLHTADDVAQFAKEASKDPCKAPLAIKLLAGISNSAKSPHLRAVQENVDISQETDQKADKDMCCNENKVKEEDSVISVESLKSNKPKEAVCSNCKVLKRKCLIGQEVRYIRPQSEQVGCKVMAQGPHWCEKNQGKVATVIEAPDLDAVTVKWEENLKRRDGKGISRKAGTVVKYKLLNKHVGAQHKQGKLLFAFACNQQ